MCEAVNRERGRRQHWSRKPPSCWAQCSPGLWWPGSSRPAGSEASGGPPSWSSPASCRGSGDRTPQLHSPGHLEPGGKRHQHSTRQSVSLQTELTFVSRLNLKFKSETSMISEQISTVLCCKASKSPDLHWCRPPAAGWCCSCPQASEARSGHCARSRFSGCSAGIQSPPRTFWPSCSGTGWRTGTKKENVNAMGLSDGRWQKEKPPTW